MTAASRYPVTTWECGVCGTVNPGDIGRCTRNTCWTGSLRPRGGLLAGEVPYFPGYHFKQSPVFDEQDVEDEIRQRQRVPNDSISQWWP